MAETITIPDLENGKVDIDTLADIVNLQEPTTETRLSGPVNTWFGVQSSLTSATGLAYTSKTAMDAAPGTKVGQAARVTEGADAGLYIWSGSTWVETDDPIETASPAFVEVTRDGAPSAEPWVFISFVRDISVDGALPGKDYKIVAFQNQDPAFTPVQDSFTIVEYDAGTWDNARTVLGRTQQVTIDRTLERQSLSVKSIIDPTLTFNFILAPQALPPIGTQIQAGSSGAPGYSWKISPTRYKVNPFTQAPYMRNKGAHYPFVLRTRNGMNTAAQPTYDAAFLDAQVRGATPGKFYAVRQVVNGSTTVSGADPNGWWIEEYDASTWNTATTGIVVVTRSVPQTPLQHTGVQVINIQSDVRPGLSFQFIIDTSAIPADGIQFGTSTNGNGFSWHLDTVQYEYYDGGEDTTTEPQLKRLNRALTNPFHSVKIHLIGDSKTWGLGATGIGPSSPRGHQLTDVRNNFTSKTWANLLRDFLGTSFLTNPTFVEDAPGHAHYEQVKKFNPMEWAEIQFINPLSGAVVDKSTLSTLVRANATYGYTIAIRDGGGGSNVHTEFDLVGDNLTVIFTNQTSVDQTIEVRDTLTDTLLGSFSGRGGVKLNKERAEITFPFGKYRIALVNGNSTEAAFELEGFEFTKKIMANNDGLIGTASGQWNEYLGPQSIQSNDEFTFVQLGTNDRGQGVLDMSVSLEGLINQIKDVTGYLPIMMCPSAVTSADPDVRTDIAMVEIRNEIVKLVDKYGTDFIDNYANSSLFKFYGTSFLADGLHENDVGHRILFENILTSLLQAMMPVVRT